MKWTSFYNCLHFHCVDVCECRLRNDITVPIDGEGPPIPTAPFPSTEGLRVCPRSFGFTGFQQKCSGTTAAPCACRDQCEVCI